MLELGVKTLLAYLLGALLGSLVLGRLRGVDIRAMGSGNAGATNAMRTQGRAFGVAVFAIDAAKGALAAAALPGLALTGAGPDPSLPRVWLTFACGLAVVVGHVYPVWFGFRGGKGAATIAGVIAAVAPALLAPLLLAWLAVLLLSGYVGLATMLSGVAATVAAYFMFPGDRPLLGFCAVLAAFVIFTHRGNVARMLAGSEHRVRRLWLFRPRAV